MKTLVSTLLSAALLALAFGLASTGAASAQACLDNRAIQEAVSSGEIMSLDAVLGSAGIGSNVEVLSVRVCDQGGRLVYIIGVLSPDGTAQNMVLSAQ